MTLPEATDGQMSTFNVTCCTHWRGSRRIRGYKTELILKHGRDAAMRSLAQNVHRLKRQHDLVILRSLLLPVFWVHGEMQLKDVCISRESESIRPSMTMAVRSTLLSSDTLTKKIANRGSTRLCVLRRIAWRFQGKSISTPSTSTELNW